MTVFPDGGTRSGCGPDDEVVQVAPEQWREAVGETLTAGFAWFESLTAVDEILRSSGDEDEIRVIARFVDWAGSVDTGGPRGRQLHVRVPRALDHVVLPSIVDLVAGAAWYEREVHDFFGVRFVGGDDRPLLWHLPGHPLRKDELLTERLETPWPGAKDPADDGAAQASRRRTLPPGVPDPEVLDDPAVTAADLVASLSGGRVRRRR